MLADLDCVGPEQTGELAAGKLAALVGVEYLGPAIFCLFSPL